MLARGYRQRLAADLISAVPFDYAAFELLTTVAGWDAARAAPAAACFKLLHLVGWGGQRCSCSADAAPAFGRPG